MNRLLPLVAAALLPASSALAAAPANLVLVFCSDDCDVVVNGKYGRRLNDRNWEFKGIEPGSRRVEATGLLGRKFYIG